MTAQLIAAAVLAWTWLRTPAAVALVSALFGIGLLLAGTWLLFGSGVALIVGSIPMLALSYFLVTGMGYD